MPIDRSRLRQAATQARAQRAPTSALSGFFQALRGRAELDDLPFEARLLPPVPHHAGDRLRMGCLVARTVPDGLELTHALSWEWPSRGQIDVQPLQRGTKAPEPPGTPASQAQAWSALLESLDQVLGSAPLLESTQLSSITSTYQRVLPQEFWPTARQLWPSTAAWLR